MEKKVPDYNLIVIVSGLKTFQNFYLDMRTPGLEKLFVLKV